MHQRVWYVTVGHYVDRRGGSTCLYLLYYRLHLVRPYLLLTGASRGIPWAHYLLRTLHTLPTSCDKLFEHTTDQSVWVIGALFWPRAVVALRTG